MGEIKFQAIQVSPCYTHHTNTRIHKHTPHFLFFLSVWLCFGWFLGAVVWEIDGDGCLFPLSSSVCHPLKGLSTQGSLSLLCASCCSVTLHLWLQGPFIIIQWLLHKLLLIIIPWVTCLLTIATCSPCQAHQGDCPGPVAQSPMIHFPVSSQINILIYTYPSRQPRKIQSTLQTERNWLKTSTYCLSGPNFWNSRYLHLRILFQIWISKRPVWRH